MPKGQDDSITILLGLNGHQVGKVNENEEEITVKVKVWKSSSLGSGYSCA